MPPCVCDIWLLVAAAGQHKAGEFLNSRLLVAAVTFSKPASCVQMERVTLISKKGWAWDPTKVQTESVLVAVGDVSCCFIWRHKIHQWGKRNQSGAQPCARFFTEAVSEAATQAILIVLSRGSKARSFT